jgi:hypothetical protein
VNEMGLRLQFLYWWTPNFVIKRELANLSKQTKVAFQKLLAVYAPQQEEFDNQSLASKGVKEQRAAMAQTHAQMVEALTAAIGHDKAVILGREALFAVGVELGKRTRSKLGVGDNPTDLIKASKILYRILGIDFHIEWQGQTNAVAVIERCALSEQYSKLTCEVLSATDEGVIAGLQPNVTMKFQEYITGGCANCRASINFKQKETS